METHPRLRELAREMKQRPLTVDELRELSRLLSAEGRDEESKAAWAKAERHAARERIAYLTYKDHQATADEWLEVAALHRLVGQADQAAAAEATAAQLKSSQRQDFGRETPAPAATGAAELPTARRLAQLTGLTLVSCIGLLIVAAWISDAMWVRRETVDARVAAPAPATRAARDAAPAPAPAPAPKAWHTVRTFTGSATKDTEPFTVQAPWRIIWATEPGQYGNMNFAVMVMRPGEAGMVGLVANVIGAGSDESYQYEGGTFYLSITTGQPYAIEIREQR